MDEAVDRGIVTWPVGQPGAIGVAGQTELHATGAAQIGHRLALQRDPAA